MRLFVFLVCMILIPQCYAENIFSKMFNWHPNYEEKNVDASFFSLTRPPAGRNIFIFAPQNYLWAVYDENGKRVGFGKASGGKDYCPDMKAPCRTVEGEFTVFRTEDQECTSKSFPMDEGGGAPMPHCMFFHQGYAIHGSERVGPKHNSHGCIRVTKKAAEWANTHYIKPGAEVIVLPYA